MTDRRLRLSIERARCEGVPIANSQDGKGYYVPATQEEVKAQIKQIRKRALSLLAQIRSFKVLLDEMEDAEMYEGPVV